MALTPTSERKARWASLHAGPDDLGETICAHVANGGSLIDLAETWDIPYGWVIMWLRAEPPRNQAYIQALNDRGEREVEAILRELKHIAYSDIRALYDEDGRLRDPKDWPASVAAAIASIETEEVFEGAGERRVEVGQTRKVKRFDKLKALELLGKNLSLFTEKVEIKGKLTLAELLDETWQKKPGDKPGDPS